MKIVATTVGKKNAAEKMAESLLKEKLAACVNIFPCKSRYWWKKKIEKSDEFIIMAKTRDSLAGKAMKKIKELHTYGQPVIEIINVEKTSKGVEDWINEVTS